MNLIINLSCVRLLLTNIDVFKMSKSKRLVSLCLVLLLIGCESTLKTRASVMRTWVGSHIDSLTEKIGAPTTKIERSVGGYVYTWVEYGQVQCSKNYITDADGIIVSWSYNNCSEYVKAVQ